MASVTRKVGNSGKLSPFWRAKFKGSDAKTIVWLTTKCTDRRKSQKIAEVWEKAARLAAGAELNQQQAQKLIRDVERIYPHPDTMQITRELADELLRDSLGDSLSGQNFEQFVAEWLESRRINTAAGSFNKYKSITRAFLEFLPERRRVASVASISTGEVRKFRDFEIQKGKSNKTVNTEVAILSGIFNDAAREGVITFNPAKNVKSLPDDSEERVPFSEQQIKSILEVADVEWRGMVLFAAHCGLRLGDCSKLTWENVNLENKTLEFEAEKTKHTKRSDRKTTVCLHADVGGYLETLAAGDDPKQPIFPALSQLTVGSFNGLSARFSALMTKAHVHTPLGKEKSGLGRVFRTLSFHSLRHSFVSGLANAAVSADVRKQMTGHSSDQIHDRYVHMDLSLQRLAISKMPSLL